MDLTAERLLAIEAVRLGADVAAGYFRGPLQVDLKSGPADVVSEADRAAESAIVDLLAARRPHDGVVGEEGGRREGSRTWFVDAIDGTLNFVHADPFWCSAVALVDADGAVAAAVHHAAAGETFSAVRGGGAWLGEDLLRRTDGPGLDHATLSTYFLPGDLADPVLRRSTDRAAALRVRGSGSIELAWVAAGRADAWAQRNMKPWDRWPGALLVAEAGGVATERRIGTDTWFVAAGRHLHDEVFACLAREEQP